MQDEQMQPETPSVDTTEIETPSEPTEATPEQEDSQEQPQTQDKKYQWAGRDVTPDELYEESRKLQKDYTQKSQKLSEYEKTLLSMTQQQPAREDPMAQYSPQQRAELEEAAKQLAPFLGPVVQQHIDAMVDQKLNQTLQEKERVTSFQKQFDEVETLAKKANIPFDREEMVEYMRTANNWNVVDAFRSRNFEKLMEYQMTQKKAQEKKLPTVTGKKAIQQESSPDKVKDITDAGYRGSLTQKLAAMIGQG